MFKNLKIGTKILIVILVVAMSSQLAIFILSYKEMLDLTHYSQSSNINLGSEAAGGSKLALQNQAEEYLGKIAGTQAKLSDKTLESVNNQVKIMASDIENMLEGFYNGSMDFALSSLPLPEMTTAGTREDRLSAVGKAYCVDLGNSDGETVLCYDPGVYFYDSESKIVKTDLEQAKRMTDDDRAGRIIVSDNDIPEAYAEEIALLAQMERVITPVYQLDNTIDTIYIGTENGVSYRYSIYNSAVRYDPRERPWYKEAVEARKAGGSDPIWLGTYVDSTGETCVTCALAYCDPEGNVLGVIAVDIYLTTINTEILNIKFGETGYAFVIDENGKIIMHPEYEDSKSKESDQGPGYVPFDTEPLVDTPGKAPVDASYANALREMLGNGTGITTASVEDKDYYIAYSTMDTTGWSIGIAVEIDEIVKPAVESKAAIDIATANAQEYIYAMLNNAQIRFIVIFAVCAMLVFIFAFSLSRAIIKPVETLTKGAYIIGGGDLEHVIEIDANDEIGELAKAFNAMTKDLRIHIRDLTLVTAEKNRIGTELNVAKKIQADMLPSIFPAFPNRSEFDIYASMRPAKEVGGDFYDFFFVDDNHLCVVIADVSGKSVPAALFMVIARTLLKNRALDEHDPKNVFDTVNNQLCENNESSMFVTAFMGILEIDTGRFVFANAGHNPPLLYRANESYDWLKTKRGFVLAGFENYVYKSEEIFLNAGDTLYLYTDGVTEAFNDKGEFFTDPRLLSVINEMTDMQPKELLEKMTDEIDLFANGAEQADDITMLALKYYGKG